MGRISNVPFNVMDMYPGDEHVDVIGVHYYDNVGPKIATQAAWDQHYMRTYNGGPRGSARGSRPPSRAARGWPSRSGACGTRATWRRPTTRSTSRTCTGSSGTTRDIAYENYYNRPTVHQLFPSTRFAQARARYKDWW
jgi:hypothetical protein